MAFLRKLIANDPEIFEGDAVFKVLPRAKERQAFIEAMGQTPPPADDSVFAEARTFFAENAAAFFSDEQAPTDPYFEGEDQAKRASLLVATILSLVKIVVIELASVDDAQVIFEALNARGTPLTATDLVKNLIFMRAQQGPENSQHLYDTHWSRFDNDAEWWRESVGIGHAQRAHQDWLLGDWLIAETGKVVSVGRLYPEFRAWFKHKAGGVEQTLERLGRFADAYERMQGRKPGVSEVELRAFKNIRFLNLTAATPLLLWLLVQPETTLSRVDRERAVQAVESFVIRRMAAKAQTRAYAQTFAEVLRATAESGTPATALIEALRAGPRGYQWPADEEMKSSFRTGRYYGSGGINRGRLALLFGAIDRRLQLVAPKSEPGTMEYDGLTVEHIIPKTWQKHWPVTGESDADKLRAEQLRTSRLHCIGNLTLVSGSLNPALSNDPWSLKREQISKHSKLQINSRLVERTNWDEDAIEERGEWLAEELGHVWAGPLDPRWD